MNRVSLGVKTLAGVVLTSALTACLSSGSGSESGTDVEFQPPPDPNSYVCNPYDGESNGQNRTQGVRGSLFYLDDSQPRYQSVLELMEFGHWVENIEIFFNQIYVPTRPWDRGFVTHGGETVTTPNGDTLYEYFGIRHEGRIQLDSKPEDIYQFAILADDGAILQMDFGSGMEIIVNNDGTHPTRMGCTNIPVGITADDKIPFQLDYHQGPRYHISVILMWRPWPANPAQENDPFCGVQGNDFYFDSTQDPPEATSNYAALLNRGWEPLKPENYLLPEDEEMNPCNEPAPVISNFQVLSISSSEATVSWTTDRPSTSQVRYVLVSTGEQDLTASDGQLRTSHVVTVTGLTPNTDYQLSAVSASASGLSTESSPLTIRTRR